MLLTWGEHTVLFKNNYRFVSMYPYEYVFCALPCQKCVYSKLLWFQEVSFQWTEKCEVFFLGGGGGGMEWSPLLLRSLMAVCGMWNAWGGKPEYSEKTCPSAALSTTNSTWHDPVSKPGNGNGRLTTRAMTQPVWSKCNTWVFVIIKHNFS
jgi:hypothetical protein